MFKEEDLAAFALDPSSIDPVAEAEVYLAYGRDSQAEEILQDALSKMPDRQDIRLKLMEIYSARGDLRHFETTLARNQQGRIHMAQSRAVVCRFWPEKSLDSRCRRSAFFHPWLFLGRRFRGDEPSATV